MQTFSLLQTKLHRPAVKAVVTRPRLVDKLTGALDGRLTLISAPAGFGKTTFVADWLARSGESVEVAWLSLDENDNTPARFLAYLIAALQTINPHIGRGLSDALRSPETPDSETVLTAVLNDLVALTEEFPEQRIVLVLDDYHALDNPQIDAALAFLLDHAPSNLHLVILSRIDPSLPLARLRARRQITEVRERDLRFTSQETHTFLAQTMGLDVPADSIEALNTRTEGWIAGLQLAAIALLADTEDTPRFIAELSGSHRYIMDYLTDEVFQRQPSDIQQFLLQTSLLNRMCAELCAALRENTPEVTNNQLYLERLEQANLFIVPLDNARRWYRYHHLFSDLLRQRLQQSSQDTALNPRTLHSRASRWYAEYAAATSDDDAIDEALHHALAAHDHTQAAVLLAQFGDHLWERGEHDRLRRWLAALPDTAVAAHPQLDIFAAWLGFTAGAYAQAEVSLLRAEKQITANSDSTQAAELRGRIAATRAFIATFKGQVAETIQHAQTALSLLTDPKSPWRSSAAIALGDVYGLSGTPAQAGEAYTEALAISEAAHNIYLALNARFKLAATQRLRGMLPAAYETCSQGIALAERSGLAQTVMAGCLLALRGDILCEWNRMPEALTQTQQAMEASAGAKHLGFAGWIMLYRARCLMAARQLAQVEETLTHAVVPPFMAAPFAAMRGLLMLARGDLGGAQGWISERGISPDDDIPPTREFEYLTLARILALRGSTNEAQALLERLLTVSRARGRVSISIILLVIRALIALYQGQRVEALAALTEALRLGEPGGFKRTFVDGGEALIPLLKSVDPSAVNPDYLREVLEAVSAASTRATSEFSVVDALSERELEVLRLIAAGLKNQQIAETLVISLNTVLYHTKNIYGKLHVTHRTQAVQRARELELL